MDDASDLEKKIDILLVDDRQENLLALEAVLDSPHYHLIKTSSGDEALRYLLNHEPALILMDVQMPNLDGYETARLIKQSERTREIPIIFITAINKDERYVQKGYDRGAVDYIYKPYDAFILRSKVAVFADLARKTRRLIQAEQRLRESEMIERDRQISYLELQSLKREQASQKKYRDLVEGINHGIVWSAHPDSLVMSFVSPSAERILGYPLECWSSEEGFLIRHIPKPDQAKVLKAFDRIKNEDVEIGIEHRFVTAEGSILWLHTGMRMGTSDESGVREIRGLSVDVTKIKNAETVLKESKRNSDFLAEASLQLSESLDYDAILHRIGHLRVPALAKAYAVHLLDSDGEITCLAWVRPEGGGENRESLPLSGVHEVIRTARSRVDPGLICVPLWVRGKALGAMTLILNPSDRLPTEADVSFAEDLARRMVSAMDNANLYKQAQAAIQARDEFLSIASHELKTPITPLKIQTQALMRSLKQGSLSQIPQERLSKMLQTSDRQLERLSRLIDDLLDISRLRDGNLTLNLEEFEIGELLTEVLERFSSQLTNAKCVVDLEIKNSIRVHWDRFRMEQVVINLLTNAMKYGLGKPIRIECWQDQDRVHLSFKDRGIGIAKEDQARIFGRFERAVSGNHFGGLGLGLYIVSKILRAHEATIGIESAIGKGSTFTLDLPLVVVLDQSLNLPTLAPQAALR